jgi:hypothetical protein
MLVKSSVFAYKFRCAYKAKMTLFKRILVTSMIQNFISASDIFGAEAIEVFAFFIQEDGVQPSSVLLANPLLVLLLY